ncbi:MAG: AAA family ATPase, partial [Gemmatimonadota bacterium]|nr:AAA family ATPase [Gemmatimonadota bacterium]
MVDEPSLFPEGAGRDLAAAGTEAAARADAERPGVDPDAPLASRMRPRTLEEFVGQEELVGPGRPLRQLIETGRVPSLVLWGPPGSGKTTLANLLAGHMHATLVTFSAVTEGIPRVRRILEAARTRRLASGRGTVVFVDEIHR